jgi:hypothetical protein
MKFFSSISYMLLFFYILFSNASASDKVDLLISFCCGKPVFFFRNSQQYWCDTDRQFYPQQLGQVSAT